MIYYSQALRFIPNADGGEDIFLLIFHQNTFTNDLFETESECLKTNSIHKYSILKYINDDFKTGDVFEFIMEYPEINEYGHCTQSKNPLEAEPNQDVNVRQMNSTWVNGMNFIGLHQSSNPSMCYLEGTDHISSVTGQPDWYYAIGQKVPWNTNCLAGPYASEKRLKIHQVFLWLKISNIDLLKRIFHPPSIPHSYIHLDYTIFFMVMLQS